MFAAAVAAMGMSVFASCDEPEPEPTVSVPRVYQIQLNTYTTKGVAVGSTISGGTISQCTEAPEPTTECLVMRGKDKTVIRGYIYICDETCNVSDYKTMFADVKRFGLAGDVADGVFESNSKMEWNVLNAIGVHSTDAEAEWTLEAEFKYDTNRSQKYSLTGAGYGTVKSGATLFFDTFSGYFAGIAEGSYDFKTPTTTLKCACERSKVLTCESCADGSVEAEFVDAETVAFGKWKMKFNANDTKAIMVKTPEAYFYGLLLKMFK